MWAFNPITFNGKTTEEWRGGGGGQFDPPCSFSKNVSSKREGENLLF